MLVPGWTKNCIVIAWAAMAAVALGGCSSGNRVQPLDTRIEEPTLNTATRTQYALTWLPRPEAPIPIAVYGVADETGAFKASDTVQTLSRAVTQGATSILIKSLQDAGNRGWFTVVERENLDNLLRERQIILEMRQRYLGESPLDSNALPSLLFAGIIIEGAITGYDTNLRTGGAGAAYLGIGASTQYRQDSVSVYLRAVSVKTGEVLVSVTSEQRVDSVALQGSAFRFVAFQELLEAEAGVTFNEPRHLAVRQAFEKAVYGLIVEGARVGIWSFEDAELGTAAIDHYERTYATALSPDLVNSIPEIFYTAEARARERERNALASAAGSPSSGAAGLQTMFAPSIPEDILTE